MVNTTNTRVGINCTPNTLFEIENFAPEMRITDNRTSVTTSNVMGTISFYSRDASLPGGYGPVAQIEVIVDNSTAAPDGVMIFSTGTNGVLSEQMRIMDTGRVGLKNTNPNSLFHIKQDADTSAGGIRLERSANANDWTIYTDTGDDLHFSYNDGAFDAWIAENGTSGEINFTGQHRCKTNESIDSNNINDYIGLIVSSTGVYNNLNNGALEINEAMPIVDLSFTDNDKKVFGVISNAEETGSRNFAMGAFVTGFTQDTGDERLYINGVGEGMIWVCDKGGNLENGDYITSSTAVGYGQLQSDDLFHNYTVAKITQDCDFSTPGRYVDLSGNEITQATYDANPANGYKCNFVGCTYHSS
jgi:hypothetical protein